jgi:hypothetical protein
MQVTGYTRPCNATSPTGCKRQSPLSYANTSTCECKAIPGDAGWLLQQEWNYFIRPSEADWVTRNS